MNITTSGSRLFAHFLTAIVVMAVLLQSGCSNYSDVGKESPQVVPQAKASTLALPYVRDANGNITASVRAGSDVVLSGKDSLKSPDDTGLPILDFKWEQASSDNVKVRLIRRTANTVSFTAPEVTQETVLNFKLTVTNAKSVAGSSTAQITVKPIRDFNRFLQYIRADNSFPVVLTTQNAIAANSSAAATDLLPVTIKLTKLVTFTDRAGVVHTRLPVGDVSVTTASWTARAGTSTSCSANENPKARLIIPRVDMDDLLNAPVAGFADAVVLSDVIETADVDGVTLEVQIDLSSANDIVTAAVPNICVNGATTPSLAGAVFATETLYANNLPRDSRASAMAYFAAIDPANAKDTMNKWLTANGFDPTVDGWNADAHAIYTNNFDLGFGRNMYMKYGACDNGYAGLPLQQRVGHCDVAAIVVNYVDVEAATKKLNPIVAVAMEYSASPGTGARYTKFYTFSPDTRTGELKRVLSVNLDRRGEEYMPQACIVCHGGTPGNATSYATTADIGAAFLSWDLDSFLFPETDPGFGIKPANDDIRKQYSRSAQSAELKKLNEGAYLTFADPPSIPGRFSLARELVVKLYGGPGLPNAEYDDSGIPAGWQPGGASDNPADSDKVYKDVFARHCRACHILQIPAAGDPRSAVITPPGATAPVAACTNDTTLANTTVGVTSQVPMGCYWEFAHAPNLATHIGDGQMPFARRTMDQMWIAKDGSQSAGQKLQTHLFNTQGINVATPGAVVACIDSFGTPITGQSGSEVLRNAWLVLGSSCSHYLDGEQWTLNAPQGSQAVLIGADTDTARFQPDVQGDYTITLTDKAGLSTTTAIARVLVAAPTAGNGTRNVVLDNTGNATIDVDVMQLAGSQSRDPLSSASIVSLNGATATVQSVTATTAVLRINVSSLTGGTVTYRLTDVDGDQSATGVITINVSASIVANDATISVNTNGNGVINLSNLVGAASQPFTLSIVTPPAVDHGRGVGAVTSPSGGSVTYTAPLGATSHFGSTLISAASVDSFVYRACFTLQPAVCDTGTVTINLIGSRDFKSVLTQMTSICSLCHNVTPPVGGAVGDANPNYQIHPLTNGTTLAPYNTTALRKAFYCMLMTNTPLNEVSPNPMYVNVATPASSFIYRKPQGLENHGGGDLTAGGSDSSVVNALDTIYQWINEGAYFTESSTQSCP